MDNGPLPSRPLHAWIALAMWLALLTATLLTSQYGMSAVTTGGYIWQLWSQYSPSSYDLSGTPTGSAAAVAVAIAGSVLTLAAIVLIVSAWLKFVTLTRALIVSYAWLEQQEDESTIFTDLLNFPDSGGEEVEGEDDLALDEAEGTLVGDIARYLGFAWAVLLVMPPVIVVVGTLF
jgi:hypothetical protein